MGKYIYLVFCTVQKAEGRRHQKPPNGLFMDSQMAHEKGGSGSFQHHQNPRKRGNTSYRLTMVLKDAEVCVQGKWGD